MGCQALVGFQRKWQSKNEGQLSYQMKWVQVKYDRLNLDNSNGGDNNHTFVLFSVLKLIVTVKHKYSHYTSKPRENLWDRCQQRKAFICHVILIYLIMIF